MTQEQQTILLIKGAISELPAAQEEACNELAEHIRMSCKVAGEPVGTLALALVGAEAQAKEQKAKIDAQLKRKHLQ
jgi:hypothetical protein